MADDFGDPIVKSVNVYDSAGALANAGSVTCVITLPDATTTSPSVTNLSTGTYQITYTPTLVGLHQIVWTATGANACSFSDVFDVRRVSGSQLISLADAKQAANIPSTSTTDDEEIRSYIMATTSLIESRIGPVLQRSVSEQVTGWDCLVLSCAPVMSVTTLTAVYSGATAYTSADVTVDPNSGIVRLLSRGSFYGQTYTVTYLAGRSTTVAPNIIQAAKVTFAHLWRTQRGVSGGRTRGDEGVDGFAAGYSLPNRALELLQFDLKTPGIA